MILSDFLADTFPVPSSRPLIEETDHFAIEKIGGSRGPGALERGVPGYAALLIQSRITSAAAAGWLSTNASKSSSPIDKSLF